MVHSRKFQFGLNPIIVKELRSRMRGVRAFATLTGILLLLSGVSYLLFRMVVAATRYSSAPVSPQIGQALFAGLAFLELLMVAGITPAVTASSLSGEQEKLTYEMLLATPLRPVSILWGKLVSALSYVLLLLFAAIPMFSLVFLFGGVTIRDMGKAIIILLITAVMFGVVGLFFSALFGRTGRSTVLTYLVVLGMLFGPMFLSIAVGIWRQAESPRWLLVPSPITALFSAILPSAGAGTDAINSIFYLFGGSFWGNVTPLSQTGIPRPIYHYSLPLFGGITLILYLLSMRLVLPTRRWRIPWKQLALGILLVLLYFGAVFGIFWQTSSRYENFSIFTQPPVDSWQGQEPPMPAQEIIIDKELVDPVPPELMEPTPTPLPPPDSP